MKRFFAPYTQVRMWTETLHLLCDLPAGIAWFVFVIVGLSLGVGLVPLALIGLVILAATVAGGRLIGVIERNRARALLGLQVPHRPRDCSLRAPGQSFARTCRISLAGRVSVTAC